MTQPAWDQTGSPGDAALLRGLLDHLPGCLAFIDADERYGFLSRDYEEWFQQPRHAMLGRRVREVTGEALYKRLGPPIQQALAGEEVHHEDTLISADGKPVIFDFRL